LFPGDVDDPHTAAAGQQQLVSLRQPHVQLPIWDDLNFEQRQR
jgi:hypothetical protein